MCHLTDCMNNTCQQWCSLGGMRGEFRSAVTPNNIRTRGNGDTVAFHEIGLQRNEKSRLKLTALLLK